MRLNKYNNFILESLFQELLLESKLVFKKDFLAILNDMSDTRDTDVEKVVSFLLGIYNKDINTTQNFIDVDKESDKVSFVPDNRVKVSDEFVSINITTGGETREICSSHSILDTLKIQRGGLHHPSRLSDLPSNKWRVVKSYKGSDADSGYERYTLHHLQNVDNPLYYIVVLDDSRNKTFGFHPYIEVPENRNNVKIGRFVNKLLDVWFSVNKYSSDGYATKEAFTAAVIEKFVNAYSAKVLFNQNISDSFEVVSEEDIRYWYLEDNYAYKTGQLGQSCMRYEECQPYMDLYVENPEVCSLLILTFDNKLLGRAILWTDIEGKKYMDRVYTYKDSFLNIFYEWATKNGYTSIYDTNIKTTIKLKNKAYNHYPYMDTFTYFKKDSDGASLSNYSISKPYYYLNDTNGYATNID